MNNQDLDKLLDKYVDPNEIREEIKEVLEEPKQKPQFTVSGLRERQKKLNEIDKKTGK